MGFESLGLRPVTAGNLPRSAPGDAGLLHEVSGQPPGSGWTVGDQGSHVNSMMSSADELRLRRFGNVCCGCTNGPAKCCMTQPSRMDRETDGLGPPRSPESATEIHDKVA